MKKITSLVFTALCLCLLVGTAKAQTTADWNEGGIWYKVIDTDKVAVCQNPVGQDYTGTITVPATVTHENVTYDVTAVGNRAFAYPEDAASTVEYVNLPGTIVSFGSCAFQYCKDLKKIVIPNSVTALWDNDFDGADDDEGATFMGCTGLEEITIGASITNMAAPNGLFNPVGPNLKKVTCYATTPPPLDWSSFNGDISNVALLVPAESLNDYLTDYWWDFASAEQHEGSSGVGIYPIGACLPPLKLSATSEGFVTWKGDDGAYNLIISTTELNETDLAAYPTTNILRILDTEYDLSREMENENVMYYVYLQSDCGEGITSTWVSTSFYYYVGDFCEYTVSGADIYYTVDPEDAHEDPMPWGWDLSVYVEFWQAGIRIATVDGSAAFGGATVSLMTGIPAVLEWKGNGQYGDPCSLLLTNAAGETILSTEELLDNEPATWTISIDNDCNAAVVTGIEKLNINNASIAPTLSKGFVTVNAEAGSIAKVTDLTGRLLKSETITRADQKITLNYANGIYLITLENGHSRYVQKVILKK
ncbi:MAG: leucine-rich repeat domain-containing protein [Dysgonamonadaceae bacterium]|jgi:hypothetical protein|nr:leucine-rich repeat domain-containing protein [Dysgonamonadaceae bacterium]